MSIYKTGINTASEKHVSVLKPPALPKLPSWVEPLAITVAGGLAVYLLTRDKTPKLPAPDRNAQAHKTVVARFREKGIAWT